MRFVTITEPIEEFCRLSIPSLQCWGFFHSSQGDLKGGEKRGLVWGFPQAEAKGKLILLLI